MEANQLSDLHRPASKIWESGMHFIVCQKDADSRLSPVDHEEMGRVQQEPDPNRNIEYQVPRTLAISFHGRSGAQSCLEHCITSIQVETELGYLESCSRSHCGDI